MVHALKKIRWLLKPEGRLIDIHPEPHFLYVKISQGRTVLFTEPKHEKYSDYVLQAEAAITRVIDRKLYLIEKRDEFDFLTYATSVAELRAHWEMINAYDNSTLDTENRSAAIEQYNRAEQALKAAGKGAEIAFHERSRILRMKVLGRLADSRGSIGA